MDLDAILCISVCFDDLRLVNRLLLANTQTLPLLKNEHLWKQYFHAHYRPAEPYGEVMYLGANNPISWNKLDLKNLWIRNCWPAIEDLMASPSDLSWRECCFQHHLAPKGFTSGRRFGGPFVQSSAIVRFCTTLSPDLDSKPIFLAEIYGYYRSMGAVFYSTYLIGSWKQNKWIQIHGIDEFEIEPFAEYETNGPTSTAETFHYAEGEEIPSGVDVSAKPRIFITGGGSGSSVHVVEMDEDEAEMFQVGEVRYTHLEHRYTMQKVNWTTTVEWVRATGVLHVSPLDAIME